MSSQTTAEEVKGRAIDLPNDRKVFLGQKTKDKDVFYIRFTNKEHTTDLMLSRAALSALVALADEPIVKTSIADKIMKPVFSYLEWHEYLVEARKEKIGESTHAG